ncbi:MAG: T9SS type A sorting domain-containing protein, partial [Bacteroidota bacterium]
ASTPSNLILQFFHGATDATTFNLSENETTLFEAVGYGNFGAERAEVLASNYILNLSSETSDQNYRANISFWRGKSATIFLFGSANDFRPWIALSNGGTFPLSLVNNVGQDVDYQISTKVKYLQASLYPNPVQTNIYLDLDVAKSGKVRVEVVEVNGKIVQVLADEMLEKGSFQFTTSLKAGVYFCRIQQEEEVLVRQFVVL